MAVEERYVLFADTETTGLTPGRDEVCEVASILCDWDLKELARFDHKIRLSDPTLMTKEAAEVNGYDPSVWAAEAVPFAAYDQWLLSKIPYPCVAVPVGHNVGFDRSIMEQKYFRPYGKFFKWSYHLIDTVSIAAALKVAGVIKPENLRLESVCQAMGIPLPAAHRAMADCEASKAVFLKAVALFKDASIFA